MPKRIAISVAKQIAESNRCRQVIVLAWDGELTHIVTYGKSVDDCAQAAAGGNALKEKWGWPELNDQPSRVKRIELAMRDLINCGEKLRLNLKDIATLHPEMFHSQGLGRVFTNWNGAVEVARCLQSAASPGRHETNEAQ